MHKILIAYECDYFKALLSNDVIETRCNQVNFTFDNKAFAELLEYIYSGVIILSVNNISSIIEISDYFQVYLVLYNDIKGCLNNL